MKGPVEVLGHEVGHGDDVDGSACEREDWAGCVRAYCDVRVTFESVT